MIKSILSAFVATTAFIAPVEAAGIHDFNPEAVRPRTTQQATTKGNCYRTKDGSSVCYMQVANRVFTVAIHDTEYPDYPASMAIDCNSGQWKSYSNMPKSQMAMWANVFCSEN